MKKVCTCLVSQSVSALPSPWRTPLSPQDLLGMIAPSCEEKNMSVVVPYLIANVCVWFIGYVASGRKNARGMRQGTNRFVEDAGRW